jgi:hypothetical protein
LAVAVAVEENDIVQPSRIRHSGGQSVLKKSLATGGDKRSTVKTGDDKLELCSGPAQPESDQPEENFVPDEPAY